MDPAESSGLWVCRHREQRTTSVSPIPESPPRLGGNGRLSQCRAKGGQRTGSPAQLALKFVRHAVGGVLAAQCPPAPFEGFSGQLFIAQLLGWDHRLVVALESGAMISFGPAARK